MADNKVVINIDDCDDDEMKDVVNRLDTVERDIHALKQTLEEVKRVTVTAND